MFKCSLAKDNLKNALNYMLPNVYVPQHASVPKRPPDYASVGKEKQKLGAEIGVYDKKQINIKKVAVNGIHPSKVNVVLATNILHHHILPHPPRSPPPQNGGYTIDNYQCDSRISRSQTD